MRDDGEREDGEDEGEGGAGDGGAERASGGAYAGESDDDLYGDDASPRN